ncbi:hypothetical protein [Sphingosinithalassobacter portus]|uniref:hypothetical protein n=1 Tax=Stakelama portus TaxID=2676234 RepID=UPI0011AB7D9E|nr:hypothetical protein [Sphingosinithalassobacter portus]
MDGIASRSAGGVAVARDFGAAMARMQVEDLFRIANSGEADGFEPEAMAAARAELALRNIAESDRHRIEAEVAVDQAERAGRASEPLSNRAWILSLLLGPFVILSTPVLVALIALGVAGYRRKLWEFYMAAIWGLIVYLILGWSALFLFH